LDEGRQVGPHLRSLRHLGVRSDRREGASDGDGFGGPKERIQFRLTQVNGGGRGGRGGGGGRGGPGGGAGGEERGIDPAEPLMLRAVNTETMASGFYRDQLGAKKEPEKIVMSDLAYGAPVKAANADMWMVTKSTVTDFPNLWAGPSLTSLAQISDANPQQKDYNWVSAELVHWRARTASRSRASCTSPRTSIRRRSTR
jgi:hypothetical protein